MAFSPNGKVLIAVGVAAEGSLCLFNVDEGAVIKSTLIRSHAVNKIVVDPNLDEGEGIEFITIGSKGTFTMYSKKQAIISKMSCSQILAVQN